MKQKLLFLLAALLSTVMAWAAPIDVETARQQAIAFFNQHQSASSKLRKSEKREQQIQLLYAQQETPDEAPLLYVFGNVDGEGYAIIAGDDAVPSVLGYSEHGTFDEKDISEGVQYWLDEYGRELEYIRIHSRIVSVTAEAKSRPPILPLINTQWGQKSPYNNLCPIDPTSKKKCVTGCVATAIAQIMYYHKWPEKGVGSYSYTWRKSTLSADFGATTYQWNKMPTKGDTDNAVATLMFHCGVAAQMQYGVSESTGSIGPGMLQKHFRYSRHVKSLYRDTSGLSNEDFEEILYNDLLANHPIYFVGNSSTGKKGHAFVCDGYKDGFFHFNFGWEGSSDGYYRINSINPTEDSGSFNYYQYIIYNIHREESTVQKGDILYELYDDGTAMILQSTATGKCVIPSSIKENGKDYIVTSIEDQAFKGCKGLTSVTIPNSMTTIGAYAFFDCSDLISVTLPNSVTSIGDHAFEGCGGLTSVTIPNSMTTIGDYAFAGCTGLTSLTIPNSVTSIGRSAFEHCSSLTSIDIPNSVTSIGGSAFRNCSGLTSVSIPNSVTSIGDYAFYNCYGITSVTFHNGIKTISEGAFLGCYKLTSITIPGSVRTIGKYAFEGCGGMTSVNFQDGVKTISEGAFSGCYKLTSITIPSSVKTIGKNVFLNCWDLNTVILNSDNVMSNTSSDNNLLTSFGEYVSSYVIGDGVKEIGQYAFANCRGLISVTISNSVTRINDYAFSGCPYLASITIPESVTDIGSNAFYECKRLLSVDIPQNVSSIGWNAFRECSGLVWISLPNSLMNIGERAFLNCSALNDIYCYADNVPGTESYVFARVKTENVTLHVPISSLDDYKSAYPWNTFGNIVALTETETGICTLPADKTDASEQTFAIDGKPVENIQKGVNIIRFSDGTTKKMYVR